MYFQLVSRSELILGEFLNNSQRFVQMSAWEAKQTLVLEDLYLCPIAVRARNSGYGYMRSGLIKGWVKLFIGVLFLIIKKETSLPLQLGVALKYLFWTEQLVIIF